MKMTELLPLNKDPFTFKNVKPHSITKHIIVCLMWKSKCCHELSDIFFFRDDKEVAVIYFRAGYIPNQYPTDKV